MENSDLIHCKKVITKCIIVLLFLCVLTLPSLEMVFKFSPQSALDENRTLAEKPIFHLEDVMQYPKLFSAYFNDNFGFRKILIQTNAYFKLKILKVSPVPAIIIGKKGWSFYNSDEAGVDTIADYRGTSPFSAEKLNQIKNDIEAKTKQLSDKHIHYLVVVAPNKNTIYPEYLPDSYNKVTNITKLDQLIDTMRSSAGSNIVDLRPSLITAKSKYPVYFRNGTHWNEYGAFIGWQDIVKTLSKYYPYLKVKTEDDYIITKYQDNKQDTVYTWVGLADVFYGESISMEAKPDRADASNGKSFKLHKVVVFCDSFGDWMEKFANDHFDNVVIKKYSKFDIDVIEKESPDVVITEVVERNISSLIDN